MATRIELTYGDDGSREHVVEPSDHLARALAAAMRGEVLTPYENDARVLWSDVACVTELIERLEEWREEVIVAVDKSSAVDRAALGIAAKMGAGKLYEILERHGRPRNRTELTQPGVLEHQVIAEGGEWDAARVIDTLGSYGWDIDDKRARSLLRGLSGRKVLEKKPGAGGRAVYRVPRRRDWLYCLDPEKDTIEDGPSTPARVAKLARAGGGSGDWWLGKRLTKMTDGDRIWIYFGGSEGKIAAMAHVKSAPFAAPEGAEKPYRITAELDAAATAALRRNPVRLTEMDQQHPQACGEMRVADVELAVQRAQL